MLRRTGFLRFRASPVVFFKSNSTNNNNHRSIDSTNDDIHWYTKIWKDRALDGGSSSLKRLSTAQQSFSNHQQHQSQSQSSTIKMMTSEELTQLLRIRLGQARDELDNSQSLPEIFCAELVEFYHTHCCWDGIHSSSSGKIDHHQLMMKNKIRFVTDLTSFTPIDLESLTKQVSKLDEYIKENTTSANTGNNNSNNSSSSSNIKTQSKITSLIRSMSQSTEPIHEAWFKCVVSLPSGTKIMIDFRSDLLDMKEYLSNELKKSSSSSSSSAQTTTTEMINTTMMKTDLVAVEAALDSLTRILRRWFSTSWMLVEELDWQSTSAAVIEQVIRHEAVHKFIPSITNDRNEVSSPMLAVKQRMKPSADRSIFAFFHPHVPNEPIVMLQIAFCYNSQYASSVDRILQRDGGFKNFPSLDKLHPESTYVASSTSSKNEINAADHQGKPQRRDTAIFYSISSTQKGLNGIELGKHLIKRAVKQVLVENDRSFGGRNVNKFSTLSPIPGFSRWAMSNARSKILEWRKKSEKEKQQASFDDCFISFFFVASPPSSLSPTENNVKFRHLVKVMQLLYPQGSAEDLISLFWTIMSEKGNQLFFCPPSSDDKSEKNQRNRDNGETTDLLSFFSEKWEASPDLCNQVRENLLRLASSSSHSAFIDLVQQCAQEHYQTPKVTLISPTSPALWAFNEEFAEATQPLLHASISDYFKNVKRRGKAFDPVAHFHLRNGARLFRINLQGDCTINGSKNSCCAMVNYEYELDKMDERSMEYENNGTFNFNNV